MTKFPGPSRAPPPSGVTPHPALYFLATPENPVMGNEVTARMSGQQTPNLLSQADFARRRKVSAKSVSLWKSKGLLVIGDDGKVDVEQSEWNLDQRPATYRGGVTHRPIRSVGNDPKVASPAAKVTRPDQVTKAAPATAASSDDGGERDLDLASINLPMAEAVRRKENMLGLLRRHELEVARGEWVRVEDVGREVEREYGTVRERLLTIPGKIAASLVGADRPEIEATIKAEITEALDELHDPAGVAGRVIAGGPAAGSPNDPAAAAKP